MPMFVAMRSLPGVTPEALNGAGERVQACAAAMRGEGSQVRWVRSFFLPESSQTHCYFEGPDLESVRALNDRAGLPYERLVPVAEMAPTTSP